MPAQAWWLASLPTCVPACLPGTVHTFEFTLLMPIPLPPCWPSWLQVLGQLYNQTTHGPLKELKQAVAGALRMLPALLLHQPGGVQLPSVWHCAPLSLSFYALLLPPLSLLTSSRLAGVPAPVPAPLQTG
jgi:hypothetical protein